MKDLRCPSRLLTPTHGLWSLREMHELKLKFFYTVMNWVRRLELNYSAYSIRPPKPGEEAGGLFGLGSVLDTGPNALTGRSMVAPGVLPNLVTEQKEALDIVEHLAGRLEMDGVLERIKVFKHDLATYPTYQSCSEQWKALREQIETALDLRQVNYISKNRAEALVAIPKAWEPVLKSFPLLKAEIVSGLRSVAFEEYTAAVFHMMRAAEYGLRIVAKERKIRLHKEKPIDAAQWSELTRKLSVEVEKINQWPARRPQKSAALGFYTGIHADVVFFKDRYRNIVSHSLATFVEPEADSVIHRVREFMTVVSSRLDETATRIQWK